MTGDVDATNTAVAYSSCTDCRTVAIAVQIVLVSGDVGDVTAQSEAASITIATTTTTSAPSTTTTTAAR